MKDNTKRECFFYISFDSGGRGGRVLVIIKMW